jgi:monofunctional glycosyltransferase
MRALWRWLILLVAAILALQLFFVARIGLMAVVNPQSSAFERSEVWRLVTEKTDLRWRQQWVDYDDISDHLKRAVIASEDDGFLFHDGVEWDALEKAWERNAKTQSMLEARPPSAKKRPAKTPKVIGGSTITQQLAKNLFLSGERTFLRKGQEFLLTGMLELILSKERILEIYLNNVEWGEGIFGAEAAAQAYFKKPASKLAPIEAARLAVMLPRPKYFEKLPNSSYVASRAAAIAARMSNAELP